MQLRWSSRLIATQSRKWAADGLHVDIRGASTSLTRTAKAETDSLRPSLVSTAFDIERGARRRSPWDSQERMSVSTLIEFL